MEKLKVFLQGVRSELRRVTWPDRKLVTKATISVIIFSLVVGVYLWVLDLAFTKILSLIFALRGA
ncbi:preprotein translocase subunit SecE [Hydrogenivirga caldilitoris]|uniref:Protein translocase subunit SecE n=1 Tax=Hydrogenivirga caldilitoris TaxID=246264 RepID=A0A497XUB7_9AQUI|nr:preprotein translocase subunit SecE [Hydrogenivirga caldilitoris]RLJ71619.1 preprotein translocase subunit SecE [Hydrogenivirga caldilitoris]